MSHHGEWYNVLAAIKQPRHADLVKNFIPVDPNNPELGYVRNELTPAERRVLGKNHGAGYWRDVTKQGFVYKTMSFYAQCAPIPEPHPLAGKLDVVESMLAKWPADTYIIGVWEPNGLQYGQVFVAPDTVSGTPIYPIPANLLDHLPDDVAYDVNGNEVGRTRPVAWKDVVQMCGWKPRRTD